MSNYRGYSQTRTTIGAPNTWVAITIPVGARNALISLEDSTAVMRVSSVNSIAAASAGAPVLAGGSYQMEGTNVGTVTVYVASDKATVAIVQFTTGG